MADVELFAFGLATPIAAAVMSISGCLLGILLTTKAPVLTGRRRFRLLVYAAIAVAMVGIWQAQVIGLIGFAVDGSAVRFDPVRLVAGLGIGLLVVFGGVLVIGYGRPCWWRRLCSGVLLAGGITATHYVCAGSLLVSGTAGHEPPWLVAVLGGALAAALVIAGTGGWFVTGLPRLRSALAAAAVLGTTICAAHYIGMSAVQVRLDTTVTPTVSGVSPIMLVGVVALGTAVNVMLWYFTVGDSTVGDLQAIFVAPTKSVEIEPWLIEEVTARVAVEVSAADDDDLPQAGSARRPARPGPAARITPVYQTAPVWGLPVNVGPSDRPAVADHQRTWTTNASAAAKANATPFGRPVPLPKRRGSTVRS